MQDKPQRKPQQYIDGFINSRPRRSVGYSAASKPLTQRLAQSSPRQPLDRTAKPLALARNPVPLTPLSGAKSNPKSKKRSWRMLTKRTALVVLGLFVLSGGWLGWKVYQNTSKVFGNNNPLHVLSAFKPVPLKGEEQGRVNILLAGNSADRADGGGGVLTDSIMMLSINTHSHEAFMLSIPRDMWVNIPGMGGSKINAANTATEFNETGYPKGGMGMLEKVINDNFGVKPNYYALVNYKAFKDAVNNVGGIDVTIKSEDPRGVYDPSFRPHEGGALKLANGVNHLDGQVALNLARARGDPFNGVSGAYGFPQSDFNRTEHQRAMMLALKEKALNVSFLSNPTKLGKMMDAIGNNVSTDFEVNELVSLYHMMKKVKSSNIQSLSLNNAEGKNLLVNYQSPTGQSSLVPAAGVDDYTAIQTFITKAINSSPVSKESANVAVLNGGEVVGLAKQQGDALIKKGVTVSTVGDAPAPAASTTIIDNSNGKKPATKKFLRNTYKGSTVTSDPALAQQYGSDFVIILGSNEKPPTDQTSASL